MAMKMDAVLNLNTAGFTGPMQGAMGGLSGMVGKLAGLAAAFVGVRAIMTGLKGALDMGGELTDVSAQTGIAVRELVILRQAFDDAGVGAGQVPQAINMMQKALTGVSESGEPTNKMFERLGLSIDQLKGMSAMDQFQAIGNAINGLGSHAEKTSATLAIFGRYSGALKALFANPKAIEQTAKALGTTPDVIAKYAASFDLIGDQIGQIKTKMKGFWAGIMGGIAPALEQVTSALNGIDLAALGEKIGNGIGILIEAFKGGEIGEMLWLSLKIGFDTLLNYLSATIGNASYWRAMGQLIIGALEGIGGGLLKIFLGPLSYIQAAYDTMWGMVFEQLSKLNEVRIKLHLPDLLGISDALGLSKDYKRKSFEENLADNQKDSYLKRVSESALSDSGENIMSAVTQMRDIISSVKVGGDPETWAKLQGLISKVQERVDANQEKLREKAGGGAPLPTVAEALAAPEKKIKAQDAANVDRFAKIGWFVGAQGNANASVGFARRTAIATEKMASMFSALKYNVVGPVQPALVTA